ncbi:MAG: site-2 protease family protein [Proteobacteria bacterium]|nr:site-2 protease family protein [Pseudomonadota bacterium]
MGLISELFKSPEAFFLIVIGLIVSITIHEFAHAVTAYKLGDPTPKLQGRVTLNPLAHLDLVGSILMLLFGFGWGKPVEYDVYNLNHPKRDTGLISVAGPLSNILLGIVLIFLSRFLGLEELYIVAYINFFLAFFNLIPIYPLDGFNVVMSLLPYDLALLWRETEKYSLIFILVLIFTNIPSMIISPITGFLMGTIDMLVKMFL